MSEPREWLATEIFNRVSTGDDIGLPEYFIERSAYDQLRAECDELLEQRKIFHTTRSIEIELFKAERDRYKAALERIANNNGTYGHSSLSDIAREALRGGVKE